MKNVKHVTLRNEGLFCLNCGGYFKLSEMPVDDYTKKLESFAVLHEHCEKTWSEPVADMSKSVRERAIWWFENGERGLSSEVIFGVMKGNPKPGYPSYPLDPDDFNRCYKLLQVVPEWKERLHLLKPLSKSWRNLVDNWDKLTEMLEEQVKTKKDNGMYDFMQTLII